MTASPQPFRRGTVLALLVAVLALAVLPLLIIRGSEFGGSDGAAEQAIAEVARAKQLPALAKLRQQIYHEGSSAQIMHIGPYSEEGPTLARLHDEWMPQNGYTFGGRHHEIYLSDVRRTAPAKLKTVLRQPIRRIAVAMDAIA